MTLRLAVFLLINFAGLALGSLFTAKGVPSDWYLNLNKAPWTPPGWVFGFAWTSIMLCFAVYLTLLWPRVENKSMLLTLYGIQWLLNASWNPIFFYYHHMFAGFLVIIALTFLIAIIIWQYRSEAGLMSLLLMPYFIWLLIASSLNAYAYLYN